MDRFSGILLSLLLTALGLPSAAFAVCVPQPITFGQAVAGVLGADDCLDHNSNGQDYYYDVYEFEGTAGQRIYITNTSATIDPDVLLIFPDKSTQYNDDSGEDTTNSRLPESGYLTLSMDGKYQILASSAKPLQTGSYTLTMVVQSPGVHDTVEFYNLNLAHYFVTAVQAEAEAIDKGAAGPGWVRTGYSYDVFDDTVVPGFPGISADPVCRFYNPVANTHFFTASGPECAAVKTDPGWRYEGLAYFIPQPVAGACPAGLKPIYRAYNNRFAFNDSNHRFLIDTAELAPMSQLGWTLEGIVMCTTAVRGP